MTRDSSLAQRTAKEPDSSWSAVGCAATERLGGIPPNGWITYGHSA